MGVSCGRCSFNFIKRPLNLLAKDQCIPFHSIRQCLLINDYYHYENVLNLRIQTAEPVGFDSCSCWTKSYISIGRDFEFLFLNGRNRRKPEKLKINCADNF